MNQILMQCPENLKQMLPCRTSLRSFDRVLEDRILAIEHSIDHRANFSMDCFNAFSQMNSQFSGLRWFSIARHVPLIFNMIDGVSKMPGLARLFNTLLMKIERCDDHQFQLLNSQGTLRKADVEVLSSMAHRSAFLVELVLRRLSRKMLENTDPGLMINVLASLTNTELVIRAVMYVRS
jgi:hypothetical protein